MQNILNNKDLQESLAQKSRESMLSKLSDVDGLDAVTEWSLAPIWWIIIAIIVIIIVIKIILIKNQRWKLSWQSKFLDKLSNMQKDLSQENAQITAINLAKIIRRIAMHKYSRKQCASLIGNDWLAWLSEKDASGFDWKNKGQILIQDAYAPPGKTLDLDSLKSLINAIKNWIK